MPITGTMIVSRPNHSHERANGAVALIHLYGPRGGEAGSVLIDRHDAKSAIARLQSMLDRQED